MGTTDSRQRLGERVIAEKAKLDNDLKDAAEKYKYLQSKSPQTLKTMLKSIQNSFKGYSPFLESVLLIAWNYDAQKCKTIMLHSCKKVLSAPINNTEFEWFKRYVFGSSVWFMRIPKEENKFMYHELLNIAKKMSHGIIRSMDSIYTLLEKHDKWEQIRNIENMSWISRQDDKKVGLLKEEGLKDIFESKKDDDDEKAEDMKSYIDSNLAINILTSNASSINDEFQNHIQTAMSPFGQFKRGPMKKVDRCVSKLENDYREAKYPKSAKLLDLIRCSVTFNTIDQLIDGYHGFMKHIRRNGAIIQLARVKNGFLAAKVDGGYRDIKVNVVYKSQNPMHLNVKMICEIQLLLINYLEEKKRIHKLYSILREEIYFQEVVKEGTEMKAAAKNMQELQFKPVFNEKQDVSLNYDHHEMYKCTVDSNLELLGIEGKNWFGVIDMKTKKPVLQMKRDAPLHGTGAGYYGMQTHHWISKPQGKYGSLCGLAGGQYKHYFSVIDIERRKQHKLTSSVLSDTYVPCFINGENEYISVGGTGTIEIWNIQKQQAIKTLSIGESQRKTSNDEVFTVSS